MSIYGNRFPEATGSSGDVNTDKRLLALENKTRYLNADGKVQTEHVLDGAISQQSINTNIDNSIADLNTAVNSMVDKTQQLTSDGQLGTFAIYDENETTSQELINLNTKTTLTDHTTRVGDLEDEIDRLDGRIDTINGGSGTVTTAGVLDTPLNKSQQLINSENETFKTNTSSTLTSHTNSIAIKANSSDVLSKTNTTPYTPSSDYHPTTQKYVLDLVAGISGDVDSVNGQTGVVVLTADNISDDATAHKFASLSQLNKLDAIEANATADQTGAEIKAAYEAEANTNAFTDANVTNLAALVADLTARRTHDSTSSTTLDFSAARYYTRTLSSNQQFAITNANIDDEVEIFIASGGSGSINSTFLTHGGGGTMTPRMVTSLGDYITSVNTKILIKIVNVTGTAPATTVTYDAFLII